LKGGFEYTRGLEQSQKRGTILDLARLPL